MGDVSKYLKVMAAHKGRKSILAVLMTQTISFDMSFAVYRQSLVYLGQLERIKARFNFR